jgi:hypothetical protein
MAYKKLVVDGKPVVAFNYPRNDYPNYVGKYLHLAGVEIKPATKEEFLKYKRTRKQTKPEPDQQDLF